MQGSKLYVGNLSYSTTRERLSVVLSEQGTVTVGNIIDGKGIGFVEMSSIEDVEKVQENVNGTEFDGRTIRVDEAKPRNDITRKIYGGERCTGG